VSRSLRDAALDYADRGWKVIPLRPRRKEPLGSLVPNGLSQATGDLATVFRWWKRAPQANVGLVANPSGLLILDVDPRHGGDDELHELERRLGALPETLRAETGGGGEHYLFTAPGIPVKGTAGEGVDVRDHAYIVAPPSVHPSGGVYAWDLAPDDVPIAPLPERWLDHLAQPVGPRAADLTVSADHPDPLRRIPAPIYVPRLTGRALARGGWSQCPFHKGGQERTPSLQATGTLWACFGACNPIGGRRVLGGNIYDLAGLLAGLPLPLRGVDFLEVQAHLDRLFGVER
jgi:hypothetical protein